MPPPSSSRPTDKDLIPTSTACRRRSITITGDPPPSSLERALNDTYKPLAEHAPECFSPALLEMIDAGLAVRPNDRPQSIAAWRSNLSRAMPAVDDATVVGTRRKPQREAKSSGRPQLPPAARPGVTLSPVAAGKGRMTLIGGAVFAVFVLAAVGYWAFSPKTTAVSLQQQDAMTGDRDQTAKQKAEAEARRKAETEAQAQKAAVEAQQRAEAEARQKAEAETQQRAAEARQKAEADARQKAATEAQQKAAADAQQKTDAEAHQRAQAGRLSRRLKSTPGRRQPPRLSRKRRPRLRPGRERRPKPGKRPMPT